MPAYRGNSEEVINVTFPGSIYEGQVALPHLRQVHDFVNALERLTNLVNWEQENKLALRLVGAEYGSLELWLQLLSVTGTVVSTLADGPLAIGNLMHAIEGLKARQGSYHGISADHADRDTMVRVIDELGRSVRRAGSIRIRHNDFDIELTDVDFIKAIPPPRAKSLPPPIRPLPTR